MTEIRKDDGIQEVVLEKQMKKAYMEYSMSVIVSRALPDVRDGLKPVHRRIIYGMHQNGMTPDKPTVKSARIVGDVMGKYHPHGDSAIYDALVRLAQDFSTRYPLAQGQGNFGSIDGDRAAAMRYTEVRMSKICREMVRDIGKDTVDFGPNFDEELEEPLVLPSRFPNLLVNGGSGIAVGMATNMAPHNLNEVIGGIIAYIDDPEITIDQLMSYIKGPDFPTGARILGREEIVRAYKTGRGRVILRAFADIENVKNKNRIVITELPYQVNKSKLVKDIADMVNDKKLEGISDVNDESGRHGIRIVIECKRDANPNVVLNNLYKFTQLQVTFGIINLALVDGVPRTLTLKELIAYYVKHQEDVVRRRTNYDLNKAKARAHIVEGLQIAIDHIDDIISIVRTSENDDEAKARFTKKFGLTEIQGQAILDMRIRRLTGLQRKNLEEEYAQLLEEINTLQNILDHPAVLMALIKEELEEIRDKYGDLRRTVIIPNPGEIDVEDMIKKEDVVITLTAFGYIKRMPEGTYKPQRRGGRGIAALTTREEDFVTDLYISSTHDTVLFCTTAGRVYSKKGYEIPAAGRTAKGTAIVNLLPLSPGEDVSAVIPISRFEEDDMLVMITRCGQIKKTVLTEFENIRKNGIIGITLDEGDELIAVRQSSEGDNFVLNTACGKAIRFSGEDVRPMGRTAKGVKAISLDQGDEVVDVVIPDSEEDKYLLTITEKGYGKMTPLGDYRLQNRGGKGLITYKIKEKTGAVVSAKVVDKTEEVMMITAEGTVIRLETGGISVMGRNTSGVKLMNITDSKIVAVARYIGD